MNKDQIKERQIYDLFSHISTKYKLRILVTVLLTCKGLDVITKDQTFCILFAITAAGDVP